MSPLRNVYSASLLWLGRRARRERFGILLVIGIATIYVSAARWIGPAWGSYQSEKVRIQASQIGLDRLESLLGQQDVILDRARELVRGYQQSQGVEPSALLLQRMQALRGDQMEMPSVYPVGRGGPGELAAFRVELSGEEKDLAHLFYAMGHSAPPAAIRELVLSSERSSSSRRTGVHAFATVSMKDRTLPQDWVDAFLDTGEGTGDDVGENQPESVDDESDRRSEDDNDDRRRGRNRDDGDRNSGSDEDDWDSDRRRDRGSARSSEIDQFIEQFPFENLTAKKLFRTPRARRSRVDATSPSIQALVRDMRLAGVLWREPPVAIVQWKGQTYYRGVGEYVGEVQVVEIERTAILVEFGGERERLE